MVGLSSLLFIWTALLFGFVNSTLTDCNDLVPNTDLLQQMTNCSGSRFMFQKTSPNGIFDLSNWSQADFDKIFYNKNHVLSRQIAGKVVVHNSTLNKLELVFDLNGNSLDVVGNTKLTTLSVKRCTDTVPLSLKVRGNKVLRNTWIKKLKKLTVNVAASDIQEFGECDFGGKPIGEVSDLAKCVYVTGDLKIDKRTRGTFGSNFTKLEKVHGCIEVDGSSLDDLKFLEKVTSTNCATGNKITGNLDLCLSSEQVLKLRNTLGKTMTIGGNKVCDDECKVAFAETHPTAKCNVIIGDITINRMNQNNVGQWDRVQILKGTIAIQGTDLSDMTIFANLTQIARLEEAGKNALHVLKNNKITGFKMPSLTTIDMPINSSGQPFVWDSNGGFMFTFAEKENWLKIINRSQLDIPVDPGTVPTPPPTTPAPTMPTTINPIVAENAKVQANNERIKNIRQFLTIGLYVFLPVVICLPVLLCVICLYNKARHWLKKRSWDRAARSYAAVSTPSKEVHFAGDSKSSSTGSSQREVLTRAKNAYPSEELTRLMSESETDKSTNKAPGKAPAEVPAEVPAPVPSEQLLNFFSNMTTLKNIRIRQEAAKMATEEPFKAPYATLMNLHLNLDPKSTEGIAFNNAMKIVESERHERGRGKKIIRLPKEFRKFTYNPKHFERTDATGDWLTIDIDPVKPNMTTLMKIVERLLTNTGSLFQENPKCFIHCMEYCASKGKRYGNHAMRKVTGAWRMIGDIHGSMFDLLAILNSDPNGEAAAQGLHPIHYYRFVFLGDYVDRGLRSLECLALLLLLGVLFPENFVILRGNHEGLVDGKNEDYTWYQLVKYFKGEDPVREGYFHLTERMIRSALEVVKYLPLVCLVNDQIFCAHGGISQRMESLGSTLDEVFGKFAWPFRTFSERRFLATPKIAWQYDKEDVVKEAGTPNFIRKKPVDLFPLKMCNELEEKWKQMAVYYDDKEYETRYIEEYKAKVGDKFGPYESGLWSKLDLLAIDTCWSDYSPKLTFIKNTRGSGGLFGDALLRKYSTQYGIEMAVFAHIVCYFICSNDLACWIIFGCNNTDSARNHKKTWSKIQLNSDDWTGVIDMIACDQFRMLLYQQTTGKDANKEFMSKTRLEKIAEDDTKLLHDLRKATMTGKASKKRGKKASMSDKVASQKSN